MSLLVLFSRGRPHTVTVGQPGAQLTVAGTQGAGVGTPKAAAVAAKLLPRRLSNYIVGRMYAK